jgi:hypothetical protein
MLTVRNLPLAPSFWTELSANGATVKGLILWMTTLLCFCALLQPTHGGNWMRLTEANGIIIATPAVSEAACLAKLEDADQSCVDMSLAPNLAVGTAAL